MNISNIKALVAIDFYYKKYFDYLRISC